MTTPTHIAVDLAVFVALMQVPQISPSYVDLALIIGSNLIDLDHLFSRPIYDPQRNPFITHALHKNWKLVLIISVALIFIRPVMFLGIGILTHFLLDFIDAKRMAHKI
jgi:hypothetical protein